MLSSESIRIFGNGSVWVAPDGTAMPASLNAPLNAAFKDLGFATEDGVKFTDTKDLGVVRVWQSRYPAKRFINNRDAMIEFTLVEWEREQIILAFGGGTITEPVSDQFRYTPPAAEFIDYRAMVLKLQDDEGYNWQIGIPRGLVTSNTTSGFVSTGPALLPITFGLVASGDSDPWFIDSDSPTFEVAFS